MSWKADSPLNRHSQVLRTLSNSLYRVILRVWVLGSVPDIHHCRVNRQRFVEIHRDLLSGFDSSIRVSQSPMLGTEDKFAV